MKSYFTIAINVGVLGLLAAGCATAPKSSAERSELADDATAALKQAKQTDPSLDGFLRTSSAYVVFPQVDKGAAIVGGSYGRGTVYAGNTLIRYADITQATVGLQAGGQQFREIVVFEKQSDLEQFKTGKLALAANLSAVGLKTGAAESAKYTNGVVALVDPIAGLMVEAAVGGQQFTFEPR
jgi:lipid-binding SYLF domain-containing protein